MFVQPLITGYAAKDTSLATVNALLYFFKDQVIPRLLDMFKAIYTNQETIWLIIPMIVAIFFMQIYFGRWKNERLSWNDVLGNMIALLFISLSLFGYVLREYSSEEIFRLGTPLYNIILIWAIIIQVILMMAFIYFHTLSKKLSFFLGSPLTVNTVAFVAIVLVYGRIPIDWITLVAFISLYAAVQLFFWGFRRLIPASKQAEYYLKFKERMKERLKMEKKG